MASSHPRSVTRPPRDGHWLQNLRAETVCLADAAEVFDIDPRTFSGLIESGEVPAIRLRRKVLIPRRALLALLHLPDLTTDDAVEGVA